MVLPIKDYKNDIMLQGIFDNLRFESEVIFLETRKLLPYKFAELY